MLDHLDYKTANALYLRYALLGPSDTPLSRLRSDRPEAAYTFLSTVFTLAATAPDTPDRLGFLNESVQKLCAELAQYGDCTEDFREWCVQIVDRISDEAVDPFKSANDFAVAATADFYSHLGLTREELLVAVPVTLRWTNQRPRHAIADTEGITGKLLRSPRPMVVLEVCPNLFDRDAVCALPYVLLHEHVCHSARFALGGPAPDEATSAFAEGWMDCVAFALHERLLTDYRDLGLPWIPPRDHREAARRFHDGRHNGATRDAGIRRFGRNTAEHLLEEFPGSSELVSPVWGLSAWLNGSPLTDAQLNTFVHAVWRALQDGATTARLAAIVHGHRQSSPSEVVRRVASLPAID